MNQFRESLKSQIWFTETIGLAIRIHMGAVRMDKQHVKPRKKPTQRRSRVTVDAIIEGAAQVLRSRGYEAASVALIAERAGVSVGSIYQYFPSKEALLAAVMERHLAEFDGHLQTALPIALDLPLADAIELLVDATVSAHLEDVALHQVLVQEAPRVGRLDRYHQSLERLMEMLVSFLSARSDVRSGDYKSMARVIVLATDALTHDLVFDEAIDQTKVHRMTQEIKHLLRSYLTV